MIFNNPASRTKLFAMVASADRNQCFFVGLGDLVTLDPTCFFVPENEGFSLKWFLPWLRSVTDPGSKIGRTLKACQKQQTSRSKLKHVETLPVETTAQGIRTVIMFDHDHVITSHCH